MAQGSLSAAQLLSKQAKQTQHEARSSASRAYYAAYQAVTALLLYARQIPPPEREAWSHDLTPELLRNLPLNVLGSEVQRALTARLKVLYELRLSADYAGAAEVEMLRVPAAVRSAAFILKIVESILPGG